MHVCRKLLTLSMLLLLLWREGEAKGCIREGFCDLSQIDWSLTKEHSLSGEWQFYWKQLLSPADLEQGKGHLTGYYSPELNWGKSPFPEAQQDSKSYATYQLQLRAHSADVLTIRFPEMASALRVWVNGRELDPVGRIGTDDQAEIPAKRLFFHDFVPVPGINTIVMQLSNYSRLTIGSQGPLEIAPSQTMSRIYQLEMIRDLVSFGAIFIMAFYHFYLWWLRKSRNAPLFFGLFCFAISVRSLTAGDGEILTLLLPNISMELQYKIEYLGLALGFPALSLLIRELYPREALKIFSYAATISSSIWFVMILVTPATIYPLFLRSMQLIIAIVGTSHFIAITLACFRKREGARIFLAGFAAFFVSGVTDILTANRLIVFMPMAHLGSFCLVFSQAILLSKRFDRAFDHAEQAEKEVRHLNEMLEQKVKERTEQINTILNNVSSGFVLIDHHGRILPGFTESCHRLLGVKLEAGRLLSDVIQVDNRVKQSFRVAIGQVFEDVMPAEVSLSQIPSRIQLNQKTLGLSCVGVRNQEQRIHAVLFTIHDATDLQEAEYHVRVNDMLLSIIQEKESFKFFLKDYGEDLQNVLLELERDNQAAVRNFLHTLKGNLAAFAVHDLVSEIHEIEALPRIEQENIGYISKRINGLLAEHEKVLRLGSVDEQMLEVNRDDFFAIEAYASKRIKDPDRQNILDLCQKSRQMSVHSYIGPLQNSAINLAQRLGKSLRCEIEGEFLRIDEHYAPVLRNLIHIIRNSVDHGIELPEARGDKNPEGLIRLQFMLTQDGFQIVVEDDGAGLDLEKIRLKAEKLGIIDAAYPMSDEMLTRYILVHGFSTADSESMISGRGVGMAAIDEAVHKLEGTLDIKNHPGLGVRFEIRLPPIGTHRLDGQDPLRSLQIV